MQATTKAGIATAAGVGTGDSPTFAGATLSGGTLTGGASGLTAAQTGGPLILGVSGGSSYAVLRGGSSGIYLNQAGANGLFVDSVGTRVNPTGSYAFSASGVDGSKDTALARASAGVVEINNGTAGTLRDLSLRNVKPTGGSGLAVFTVATLPATAATGLFEGSRAFVTDSNAVSYTAGIGSAVAAGGSTIVPVIYLGGTWRIG